MFGYRSNPNGYEIASITVSKNDWWANTKVMIVKGYLIVGLKFENDFIETNFIKKI